MFYYGVLNIIDMLNISESITKKADLINNEGNSQFLDHAAQQPHQAYEVFYNFLAVTRPARILEIGTGMGGFSAFLKICCNDLDLSTSILSFDVVPQNWFDDIRALGVDIRVENIFSRDWTSVQEDVIDYVQSDGVTVVLCDGRFKIREFEIFAKHIKEGDFIMAHDYAENEQVFEDKIHQKIWNWCEVTENDISRPCLNHNLIDFKREEFNGAAWVCKQKQPQ